MNVAEEIRKFLIGETDIVTFREMYDTNDEINDYLQSMVDAHISSGEPFLKVEHIDREGNHTGGNYAMDYFLAPETDPGYPYGDDSYTSVRRYLTIEFRMLTHNVRTASGALAFYQGVYDLFYQLDQSVPYCGEEYSNAFVFALEVIPDRLSGGDAEIYIQEKIIPLFPESMTKSKRIKAIKDKIREEFRSEKGYPQWIQSCEWPVGKDGKPGVYLGNKKKMKGEVVEYYFRDESDGSTITVIQYY